MLKLSLFASRQFTAINAATVLFYGALAGAGYLLVLRCELTLGYSATAAGAVLIPSSVVFLALSPVSGALVRRGSAPAADDRRHPDHRRAASSGWPSARRELRHAILPGTLLWGLGLGLTVTPLTAAVLAAVSRRRPGRGVRDQRRLVPARRGGPDRPGARAHRRPGRARAPRGAARATGRP